MERETFGTIGVTLVPPSETLEHKIAAISAYGS